VAIFVSRLINEVATRGTSVGQEWAALAIDAVKMLTLQQKCF
jgi:hypothetical protein